MRRNLEAALRTSHRSNLKAADIALSSVGNLWKCGLCICQDVASCSFFPDATVPSHSCVTLLFFDACWLVRYVLCTIVPRVNLLPICTEAEGCLWQGKAIVMAMNIPGCWGPLAQDVVGWRGSLKLQCPCIYCWATAIACYRHIAKQQLVLLRTTLKAFLWTMHTLGSCLPKVTCS